MKEPSHCPCLYLNPDQGPPSLPHPTAYVALGMEGVCRDPWTPHPVTTLRYHHYWPFCKLLPTSTLPVPPTNPPWSLSKESVHCFPGCQLHQSRRLPRPPITTLRVPTQRERKVILKSCLSEDGRLLGISSFIFSKLGIPRSFCLAQNHEETSAWGSGLPKPVIRQQQNRFQAHRTMGS